ALGAVRPARARHDHRARQEARRRLARRCHQRQAPGIRADRPAVVRRRREVRARRRRARPRHRGQAPLRRPQLAARRGRVVGDLRVLRRDPRLARRLLRRLDRLHHHALLRPLLRVPGAALGIALGSALAINGFHHGPINIQSGNILIPLLVISYVLIPYIGRPLRGQVLSLREKEFVEASISQGASALRVMFSELLPNIASSVLVFFTLIIANNIVLEAALSYLGAGVQDPTPSWGKLISEGQQLIVTRPALALAPGIAIILTVLALNIFGDGLRDALDPRAKVRVEH